MLKKIVASPSLRILTEPDDDDFYDNGATMESRDRDVSTPIATTLDNFPPVQGSPTHEKTPQDLFLEVLDKSVQIRFLGPVAKNNEDEKDIIKRLLTDPAMFFALSGRSDFEGVLSNPSLKQNEIANRFKEFQSRSTEERITLLAAAHTKIALFALRHS